MFEVLLSSGNSGPPVYKPYKGIVPSAEFVTDAQISSLAGITAGGATTIINAGWIHYQFEDGTEFYIAKCPIRRSVSWNALNTAGCVFGSKIVTIAERRFKVRLLKGFTTDPITDPTVEQDAVAVKDTEWGRFILPVSLHKTGDYPNYANFTNAQLGINVGANNGAASLVQETRNFYPDQAKTRGQYGTEVLATCYQAGNRTKTQSNAATGWRPVLELIL